MRVLIVAGCVPPETIRTELPGVVTVSESSYSGAVDAVQRGGLGAVIVPDEIEARVTGSALDVVRVCRGRSVPCLLISDTWEAGAYGAAVAAYDGAPVAALDFIRRRLSRAGSAPASGAAP